MSAGRLPETGIVIEVTVTNLTSHGCCIETGGVSGLVVLGELSWFRVANASDVVQPGDRVLCKVIGYPANNTDASYFLGSLRQAHPDDNPWRDPAAYSVGVEFRGIVAKRMTYGFFVQHPMKAVGLLQTDTINSNLEIGDEIDVVISEVDVVAEQFSVELQGSNVAP